jgi:hypothetical protein
VAEVVRVEVQAERRELLLRVARGSRRGSSVKKGQQEHRVGRVGRARRRRTGAAAAMAGLEVPGVLLHPHLQVLSLLALLVQRYKY